MTEPSTLDERLAEIDRRLRTIQSDLGDAETAAAPPAEPLHVDPPQPAPPATADGVATRLERVCETLERHGELLARAADALAGAAGEGGGRYTTIAASAGPFADADAVRAFCRALAELPQVAGVAVREYGVGGQVTVDVRLA